MVYWGLVFLFLVAGAIICLLVHTDGRMNSAQWFSFLIAWAMLAGIAFWLFTESTGTFEWKRFGINFTGGAAIGAGFILIAWHLVNSEKMKTIIQPYVIVRIPTQGFSRIFSIVEHSPEIVGFDALSKGDRVLFEFGQGQFSATVTVRHFSESLSKVQDVTYQVNLAGKIK